MSVDYCVAIQAGRLISKAAVEKQTFVTLTRVDLEQALAEAYMKGLDKGADIERARCAGIVKESSIWPSRAGRSKIADLFYESI